MSLTMDITGFDEILDLLEAEGRNVISCRNYLSGLVLRLKKNEGIPFARIARGFITGMSKPVQVVFSQYLEASTNFRRITLPGFKHWTGENVCLARGLTYHESGHLEFTDPESVFENVQVFSLLNALEDVRMENELIRKYPGAKLALTDMEFLFRMVRYLQSGYNFDVLSNREPAEILERFVSHYALYRHRKIEFIDILLEVDIPSMDSTFGCAFRREVERVIDNGLTPDSTTSDMVNIATTLYEMLKELSEESASDSSNSAAEDDDGNAGDDEGQDQAESQESNEAGDAQDSESNSSENGSNDDHDQDVEDGQGTSGNSDPESEAGDEDHEQDGNEESGSSSSDQSESNDQGQDGSQANDANDDENSQPADNAQASSSNPSGQSNGSVESSDQSFAESAVQAMQVLTQRGKQAGDKGDELVAAMQDEAIKLKPEITSAVCESKLALNVARQSIGELYSRVFDFLPAKRASVSLRARLSSLLQSQKYQPSQRSVSGGRICPTQLARIPTGSRDVFIRRNDVTALNTAVMVCLDASASMVDILDQAKDALAAMLLALEMPDVSYACSAFESEGLTEICDFGQRISSTLAQARLASLKAGCYTPTAGAVMNGTMKLLERHEERKIMFVITDGIPDHLDGAIDMITEARANGIEVYGIGIQTEQSFMDQLFGENLAINVDDLHDLTYSLFGMLQRTFVGGRAA